MSNQLIKKTIISIFISLLTIPMVFSGERSIYNFSWLDPDKEVYVLQNRKFRKVHRIHFSAGYFKTVSGAFVSAKAIQGRVGFFFTEDWGFEALYSKNSGDENETATSVRNPGGPGSIPFRRIVDGYMGGLLLWSPFYAKINTFNKIVYVDWMLGLGYAKLEETNNREELDRVNNSKLITESHTGIIWETALKFYFNERFHARLDLTTVHYKARKALSTSGPSDEIYYSNYDLGLSLGVNF